MKEAEIERIIKPLGNRRRIAILLHLRKRQWATVTDISEFMHLSLTATSRHLSMLERAGFLEKKQSSLNVYYRISPDAPPMLASLFAMA